MKRRDKYESTTPTIWVIPEDEIGYLVFQAIVRVRKINARVRLVGKTITAKGKVRNIVDLAHELEGLLEIVLQQKSANDCIIIIHDTDESVQTYRESYDRIAQICQKEKFKPHVTLIKAQEEVEAWLLADEGLCKWLGITAKSWDSQKHPSQTWARLVNKKTGKHWNTETKQRVVEHMNATGIKYSDSMRNAINTFLKLRCASLI